MGFLVYEMVIFAILSLHSSRTNFHNIFVASFCCGHQLFVFFILNSIVYFLNFESSKSIYLSIRINPPLWGQIKILNQNNKVSKTNKRLDFHSPFFSFPSTFPCLRRVSQHAGEASSRESSLHCLTGARWVGRRPDVWILRLAAGRCSPWVFKVGWSQQPPQTPFPLSQRCRMFTRKPRAVFLSFAFLLSFFLSLFFCQFMIEKEGVRERGREEEGPGWRLFGFLSVGWRSFIEMQLQQQQQGCIRQISLLLHFFDFNWVINIQFHSHRSTYCTLTQGHIREIFFFWEPALKICHSIQFFFVTMVTLLTHTHARTHTNITHTKIYFKLCCQEYLTGGWGAGGWRQPVSERTWQICEERQGREMTRPSSQPEGGEMFRTSVATMSALVARTVTRWESLVPSFSEMRSCRAAGRLGIETKWERDAENSRIS